MEDILVDDFNFKTNYATGYYAILHDKDSLSISNNAGKHFECVYQVHETCDNSYCEKFCPKECNGIEYTTSTSFIQYLVKFY
jgi:hypothetical protein